MVANQSPVGGGRAAGSGPAVAVLGAGLLGSSLALELAWRGCRVDLFEREHAPMTGAALGNEGKLHLGFIWAGDPSLATARLLAEGSLRFFPLLRRWLGPSVDSLSRSAPYLCAVPHGSMVAPDDVLGHLDRVGHMIRDLARDVVCAGASAADVQRAVAGNPVSRLSPAELAVSFSPEAIAAAARTPEIAVHPVEIADRFTAALAAEPAVRFRPGRRVERVEQGPSGCRVIADGRCAGRFDAAVNALWDGRLPVDAASGLPSRVRGCWRAKYGLRLPVSIERFGIPSVTMMLGRYGDMVDYRNGESHVSWYPAGLIGMDAGLAPPESWRTPGPEQLAAIRRESVSALTERCPAVARLPAAAIAAAKLVGGPIFAAGETDIDDPESGLHRRTEVGIRSSGRYFSVDPGKYCLAPLMALHTAERVLRETA